MDLYNGWLLLIIDTYNHTGLTYHVYNWSYPNIFPTCWEHTIDVGKIPKMLGTYYGCWDIPYMLTIIIIVIISFDYLSFFIYLLFFFIIIYC